MPAKILIALCLLGILVSCSNKKKEDPVLVQNRISEENYRENLKKIDSLKPLILNGDIITRTSNSWDSEQIKDFQQKDKTFTHAGIATFKDGKVQVLHVMAKDSMYKTDLVLYEPLDSFLNPKVYTAFGLFRFNLDSTQIQKMIGYANGCYARKVTFDYLFENSTDNAMTCTELLSKAIIKATDGTISFTSTPIVERRHISLIKEYYRKYKPKDKDLIGRPITGVDDLITNPACHEIRRFFCLK